MLTATLDERIGQLNLIVLGTMLLLWGLSWPAMRRCLQDIPPLWMVTLRFASAAGCLFAILPLMGMLRASARSDWPIVASVGLLQMMAFTAPGEPIVGLVVSVVLLKEPLTASLLVGR
ncbi:EamA family transporter [Burkholderia sp. WAC0059]|uniref:EamA family transporter n=1 Tax=Burkholderia sp. WAC0059 TaxID=2066022 RepID=UPI0011AEE2E2|nr:EamA family transporter [Burkholderia sp. WAC0059]